MHIKVNIFKVFIRGIYFELRFSDVTSRRLERYTLFQDGKTQQVPSLSDEAYAADDLS